MIDNICKEILDQIKKARRVLSKISELQHVNYLNALLASLESSAKTAITERNQTKEFLEVYK